jgi:hypothetical protein
MATANVPAPAPTPAAKPTQQEAPAAAQPNIKPPQPAVQGKVKCGAQTKKGTSCSRWAKDGSRYCMSHGGGTSSAASSAASGGSQASGEKKCSHVKKDNKPCSVKALGVDSNGAPACYHHGGPSKKSLGITTEGSGGVAAQGPLAGIDTLKILTHVARYFANHEDEALDVQGEAFLWLNEFLENYVDRTPSDEEIYEKLSRMSLKTSDGKLWTESFPNDGSMMKILVEELGQTTMQWLVEKLRISATTNHSFQKETATIWTIVKKELDIQDIHPPKNTQPQQGVMGSTGQLSSDAKPHFDSLMARVDGQRTAIEDAQAQHEVADEVPNLFGGDN